jgi:Raf kinase inhibitor-like YbhB/YbcL family protein
MWLALLAAGCGAAGDMAGRSAASAPAVPAAEEKGFRLSSAAFAEGQEIPARYTCEGLDLSPPLAWSAPPAGTKSLALLVSDPDAPDPAAPRMVWTHWLLLGLPPAAGALPEQAGNAGHEGLPPGTLAGLNDWGRADWGGPCPPVGRHRYRFTLFALDTLPPPRADWTRPQLEALAGTRALARAELLATYRKRQP